MLKFLYIAKRNFSVQVSEKLEEETTFVPLLIYPITVPFNPACGALDLSVSWSRDTAALQLSGSTGREESHEN